MTHISDCAAHAARARSVLVFLLVSAGLVAGSSITADAGGSPRRGLMAQAAPAPSTPGTSSPAAKIPGQQAPTRGPATLVEARISDLREQLHITPAQEAQFKAYADVMRDNAQAMHVLFQQRAQDGGGGHPGGAGHAGGGGGHGRR
jgi:hypothetical protein